MEPPLLELILELRTIKTRQNPLFILSSLDPISNYARTMLGVELRNLCIPFLHLKCRPGVNECIEALVDGSGLEFSEGGDEPLWSI